jgi:hypothetical protein
MLLLSYGWLKKSKLCRKVGLVTCFKKGFVLFSLPVSTPSGDIYSDFIYFLRIVAALR